MIILTPMVLNKCMNDFFFFFVNCESIRSSVRLSWAERTDAAASTAAAQYRS